MPLCLYLPHPHPSKKNQKTKALRAILILTQTQLRLNSSQIRLETHIQYGDFSFIAFPDLYTLFENPLDNAITACSGIEGGSASRCIRLRIFKEKDLIWVETRLYNFYKCQHCCRINCFKAFITTLDFMLVSIFLTKVV
ncbi:GHKL domain-containing protein [Enterocloster clostridioformis]|uniref:Sensor histidine kinase n=2 Tax=Enterocloster clostridioformis TaxID=1531 RepID=A0AAP9S763_9FIRM|nr:sensor histidine kinase [Enterocloster clostridioformis]